MWIVASNSLRKLKNDTLQEEKDYYGDLNLFLYWACSLSLTCW